MRDLYEFLVHGELRVATRRKEERGEGPYIAATLLLRDGHVLEFLQKDAGDERGALTAHQRRVAERTLALRRQLAWLFASINGGGPAISALLFVVMLVSMDMDSKYFIGELAWRALLSMMVALAAAAAKYRLKRWLRARLGIR